MALTAMHTFLLVNGLELHVSQDKRAGWILDLAVAGSTADEKIRELADELRRATRPHPDEVDEDAE